MSDNPALDDLLRSDANAARCFAFATGAAPTLENFTACYAGDSRGEGRAGVTHAQATARGAGGTTVEPGPSSSGPGVSSADALYASYAAVDPAEPAPNEPETVTISQAELDTLRARAAYDEDELYAAFWQGR